MSDNFWDEFDDIVCLNLTHRTDRKEQAEKVFEKLGIKDKVRFSIIEKDPVSGKKGCFEHHISLLRKGYTNNFKNMLLFEDDLSILNLPSQESMNEVIRFMRTDQTWDLLYLGASPNVLYKSYQLSNEFKFIKKIQTRFSHAYIVSERFMRKMHNVSYETFETHIDNLYVLNEHAFAVFPTWFVQTESSSDINNMFRFPVFVSRTVGHLNSKYISCVNIPMIHIIIGICVVVFLILLICACVKRRSCRK